MQCVCIAKRIQSHTTEKLARRNAVHAPNNDFINWLKFRGGTLDYFADNTNSFDPCIGFSAFIWAQRSWKSKTQTFVNKLRANENIFM